MENDAQDVIEALNPWHYVSVGQSMVGKVVQLLASRRLSGLKGVVLSCPALAFIQTRSSGWSLGIAMFVSTLVSACKIPERVRC